MSVRNDILPADGTLPEAQIIFDEEERTMPWPFGGHMRRSGPLSFQREVT